MDKGSLTHTAGRLRRGATAIAATCAVFAVSASSAGAATFDVNNDTTGPGPPGASCAGADFTTIQGAVDAAEASGDGINDTVRVCAGTYNELVTIAAAQDGLDLLGAQLGADARTRSASDETLITGDGPNDGGVVIAADDAIIDGFLIEDEDPAAPRGGINVTPPATGHSLQNNIIRDNVLGIRLENTSSTQTVVRHNLLDGNNQAGSGSGEGIRSDNGSGLENALIEENVFTGHANNALLVSAGGSDITFADNELNTDGRIELLEAEDVTIEDNAVTDSTTSVVTLGGDNDGITVQRNTFSGGDFTTIRVTDTGPGPNLDVSVIGNTLLGDPVEITDTAFLVDDGALDGELEAHFNRIAGNSTGAENADLDDAIDAENNWWGCNEGPGQPGCDNVIDNVDFDPWLVLGLTASPTSIAADGGSSQLTASLTKNSVGAVAGAGFPDLTPVSFSSTLGTIASPATTSNGVAGANLVAGSTAGTAIVSGGLDSETAVTAVAITPAAEQGAVPAKKKCKNKKGKKKKCKKKK